jgi:succinate-semialdehyde dehydrogenase / glutarate-semialdehyde dehydrogenase
MKIKNPRTGQYYYEIYPPTAQELKTKTDNMRQAQIAWQASGIEFRIKALQAWKEVVAEFREELIDALCMDTGRKWETLLEVDLVASSIERWSNISREFFSVRERKTSSIPFLEIEQGLEPYHLVGVISPWNFPLLLSLIDTIPALMAGCCVIVKPSEVTPRFIEVIQKTINQVPDLLNVINYVEGGGEVGSELCKLTDIICFTGSTATGKKVYQAACDNFIPVFLELGGKDAVIVTETADIEKATSAILWGSVANAGQSCLSIERIYVQRSIFNQFLSRLVGKANQLKLAFPTMDSGQIGPIISEKQVAIINNQLEDAFKKGATLKAGSTKCEELDGGYYCRPTILTNVNHDMKIMTEETFGPILPVMMYSDIEEAIALANGTQYGLSGAVFAGSEEEAMSIARQMKCGAVSINDAALTAVMHEGEKNSFKMSGIGGTRMGPSAIKRFMKQKAYLINSQGVKDSWWFN